MSNTRRTALITGSGRNIGRASALALAADGFNVVLNGSSDEAACISVANEAQDLGVRAEVAMGNVGIEADARMVAKQAIQHFGAVDVLVNNAGTAWAASFGQVPEVGWDKVMDLNVKSPFFLIQALTPLLQARASAEQTAAIINIGSIAGMLGNGLNTFSYAASKSAIHQLTRIMATELAPSHIRVNAIAPGRFYSKMTEFLSEDQAAFEEEEVLEEFIPSEPLSADIAVSFPSDI